MYQLHAYHGLDGYRWGLVAENGDKLGSGGQGYSNSEDMETVLEKLFIPAAGQFMGAHVPWEDCDKHNSKQGKCYKHALVNAKILVQSLREDEPGPSPHDP